MIEIPRFLTLLLGAGLIGLGVMVFVFLIKFLFARSSSDESDSIEVKEKDQPELVAFIHQIAKETNTPVPKKIFLSPEVNACVFYHSSFWSMFFPVRKNLKIGLGLVNAVNVSELKAVIAHEFGHFSQRSMKVGSYVYQVNRIIYDMLYNNKGYVSSLQGFARVSNIFALFAQLTIIIVQGIQWILIQMFSVVNKSHRSLSRQMEFHADHVAAAVSGSNNMISALRRIELADSCYQAAIDVCNSFWNENKVVANIYAGQSTVLQLNAPRWQIELQNGLPLMDQAPQHKTANRVNFKDQWASHPTLEDRVAQLEKLGLEAPVQSDAAWSLCR
jgi:Zn-dependent protease with chaperone function